MSSDPSRVANGKLAPFARVFASGRNGRSGGAPRNVAPSASRTVARRSRFSSSRAYATSTSNVPNVDPYEPPATPPISTKSTRAPTSASSSATGSNVSASGGTLQLVHPARPRRLVRNSAFGCFPKCLREEAPVVAVVDLLGLQREPFAHQVEEVGERRDRGGDDVALDARDRGLARARTRGELALAQAVAPAGGGEKRTSCLHGHILSDVPRDEIVTGDCPKRPMTAAVRRGSIVGWMKPTSTCCSTTSSSSRVPGTLRSPWGSGSIPKPTALRSTNWPTRCSSGRRGPNSSA